MNQLTASDFDSDADWHPLGLAQHGVWLDSVRLDDPGVYQVGSVLRICARLAIDTMRAATRALLADHDTLRLRIDPAAPRQRLAPVDDAAFAHCDLADEGVLAAHLAAGVRRGFPLGDHPLFRVEAIRLADDDWCVVIAAHHLICDGVSIAILEAAWTAHHDRLAGRPGTRAPIAPSSMVAGIADDLAYAASPAMADDLSYWRGRMTPLPERAFDRPVPGDPDGPAPLRIAPDRYAALAAAARGAGTTAHRALVALAGIALSRRYGRRDLAVGMAVHGREPALLNSVGMFARLIAVRCPVDPRATLGDTVRTIAAGLDADLRHARVPIDLLARELELATRDHGPLFDVAVTIMPWLGDGDDLTVAGVPIRRTALLRRERTPVSFYLHETADGSIVIAFGFDPQAVGGAEVDRIADRFAALLQRFCDRPAVRVATIAPLATGEAQAIDGFAHGRSIALPAGTALDAVATRIAATPAAPAILDDDGRIDYATLDARATRLARRLVAAGIAPGQVVAVALERSPASVVAIIGIFRAGAVYLPIDPGHPAGRIATILAAADARIAITRPGPAGCLPAGLRLLDIDRDDSADAVLPPPPAAGDTAYILFTSGSTGVPKGVVVPHRALVNLDIARQDHDPIGAGDRVLAAISVGFDVSIGQLLLPLMRGAAIVVAPDLRDLSPFAFWALLARHGVTHVNSVPSFMDAMLAGAPADARLTRLMLGGEPLSAPLARRLRTRLNDTPIVNVYGPTESCIDASVFPVPAEAGSDRAALPIGCPLPNYAFHILDDDGASAGIGRIGELHIGGPGLATCYLGDPALTAARFLETDHGRLYRTGDLAAWQEDGTVAFLGRVDGQVKIRGHRVETGEIEAALLAHPAVTQAAVIARADPRGLLRLLGYVVGAVDLDPALLGPHLAATLPSYMVPASIVALPALPLTANGKLDARALPDPGQDGVAGGPPRTTHERLVAALFMELFGLEAVGRDDDFFRLGGHSLLATQVAARLRDRHALPVPIRALFEAPTVAGLAARLDALGTIDPARPPLHHVEIRPAAPPLSFAQERLWFVDRMTPDTALYNMPMLFRIDGALDEARLVQALAALADRHPALRTALPAVDGLPVQRIASTIALPFHVEDLADADAATVQARAGAEALRPFDLGLAPLWRFALFRLGGDRRLAVFTIHHIIADGWSLGVLLAELGAFHAGRGDTLPTPDIDYIDYALWQRALLAGGEQDRQLAFWRDQLTGAPDRIALPTDRPRPPVQSHRGGLHPVRLSAALSRRIARFAQERQASLFTVLLAAWTATLARWTGQDDLVVGTAMAGRIDSRLEPLVGLFVNTLPVRTMIDRTAGFGTLVDTLRDRLLDIHAHQDVPFEKLVEALCPPRDPSHHPLFQVMLVLQNTPAGALALGDARLEPVALPAAPARFDLTLSLGESVDGIVGEISYAADLFDPATIAGLATRLTILLDAALADPTQAIGVDEHAAPHARSPDAGPDTPHRPSIGNGDAVPPYSPPRTPDEAAMATRWADLLGVGRVGIHDNFFALGGHSLVALRLIAAIAQDVGRDVPVGLIFRHQSVAALCAALADGVPVADGPLVPIQAGDGPPLFCVHPIGGGVFGYAALVRTLVPGRAVYGLQAAGFDGPATLPDSVTAMADDYVAAIRAVQPAGPYHLLGHSFGGLVAHAMAVALLAAGEDVTTLALLDTDLCDAAHLIVPPPNVPPGHLARLVAHGIALAARHRPAGRVPSLLYLRADGDGRDTAREGYWHAFADHAPPLPPVACGHYAMLDADQADGIARRLGEAGLNLPYTPGRVVAAE